MSRIGRPRIKNPRRNAVTIRFDDMEFRTIALAVSQTDMPSSKWIRAAVITEAVEQIAGRKR